MTSSCTKQCKSLCMNETSNVNMVGCYVFTYENLASWKEQRFLQRTETLNVLITTWFCISFFEVCGSSFLTDCACTLNSLLKSVWSFWCSTALIHPRCSMWDNQKSCLLSPSTENTIIHNGFLPKEVWSIPALAYSNIFSL